MRPHPSIRDAALYDAPIAARTLARAFDADPSLNWALRRDEKRRQAMLEFFDVSFRVMTLPFGCVQMTEDGAGVALWTPPGKWQLGVWKQLGLFPTFVRVLGAARLPRMVRCMNVLQERHPRVPHYYLFAMGVDPE